MVEAAKIRSIADFIERVMQWTKEGEKPHVFRGQAFSDWKTEPKLYRKQVGMSKHESDAVRELVSIHPQEFRDDTTMFDRLVRMQHYGLPTRLLDVTTNPLVALYFATAEYKDENDRQRDGKVQGFFVPKERRRFYDSDRVSILANLANLTSADKEQLSAAVKGSADDFNETAVVKRLVSFIQMEKPNFEPRIQAEDLSRSIYVKPKMSNRRIIAQSGAFIIYGARSAGTRDIGIQRIAIEAGSKALIREQLVGLGIHAATLFPEIDKAAEHITARYSLSV